jgi:hypothetical protein
MYSTVGTTVVLPTNGPRDLVVPKDQPAVGYGPWGPGVRPNQTHYPLNTRYRAHYASMGSKTSGSYLCLALGFTGSAEVYLGS